jgi:peptidoglycan/LPS O-acetylase OafA/YrhL
MQTTRPETYRSDIDGLRAIAVLLVVAFHAFPNALPGGFVGVDVFFVISGFLITGIIVTAASEGRFDFRDFYARRVRRLFPSLATVIAAVLVAGWFSLLPDEYAQFGKHSLAGTAFVSNFALLRESGYFDAASDTKPLLHLWSLGIEEQFYLAWPILLVALLRRGVRPSRVVIALMAVSFTLSVFLTPGYRAAAFYLPVTRAWELLLGAAIRLLASNPSSGPHTGLTVPANVLSVTGLCLLSLPAFVFNSGDEFPGWRALSPTIGAGLVIVAGPTAWLNRVLLSWKPLVGIGKISFPLYLWHWPMLTLARIVSGSTPDPEARLCLVGASFALAGATYRFVEKPIRTEQWGRSGTTASIVAVVVLGVLGGALYTGDGIASRFEDPRILRLVADLNMGGAGLDPTRSAVRCEGSAPGAGRNQPRNACLKSPGAAPTVALVGDSHAVHLFPGLFDEARATTWLMITRRGCPPLLGVEFAETTNACDGFGRSLVDRLGEFPSVRTVILSFMSSYFSEERFAAEHVTKAIPIGKPSSAEFPERSRSELLYLGLNRFVSEIENSNRSVILIADVPELPFFPRDCLRKARRQRVPDVCALPRSTVTTRQSEYRRALERLQAAHPRMRIYDPVALFCDDLNCAYRDYDTLFYRDSHHLSLRGSARVARGFLAWQSGSAPTATNN